MTGINLSDLTSNLASFMPSGSTLIQNIAESAAVGVVVAGLKAQLGNGGLDPLGILPHPQGTAPAVANNSPAVVSGATITASAFASLPPTVQAMLTASGVHIVVG
jgi:hypothetical protein